MSWSHPPPPPPHPTLLWMLHNVYAETFNLPLCCWFCIASCPKPRALRSITSFPKHLKHFKYSVLASILRPTWSWKHVFLAKTISFHNCHHRNQHQMCNVLLCSENMFSGNTSLLRWWFRDKPPFLIVGSSLQVHLTFNESSMLINIQGLYKCLTVVITWST